MALSSETIAAIRAEREALASQVAALDAALLALDAVFGDAPAQPRKARKVKAAKAAKVKAIAPTADASDALITRVGNAWQAV